MSDNVIEFRREASPLEAFIPAPLIDAMQLDKEPNWYKDIVIEAFRWPIKELERVIKNHQHYHKGLMETYQHVLNVRRECGLEKGAR